MPDVHSSLCAWAAVRGAVVPKQSRSGAALVVYNFVGDSPGSCTRHIAAVDPFTGDVHWRYDLPAVPSSIETGDLTGDGIDELIFTTPGIRNGCSGNGLPDSVAYLFALSTDGELVWCSRIGGGGVGGDCCILNCDGDGLLEVVTVTGSTDESDNLRGRIAVWNGRTGELISDYRQPMSIDIDPVAVPPGENRLGAVFTLDSSMTVREFVLSDGQITGDCSFFTGARLPNWAIPPIAADVLGDSEKEILVWTGFGEITCLNQDLKPLARIDFNLDKDDKGEQRLLQWLDKDSRPQLTFAADRFYGLSLAANPWYPVRSTGIAVVLGFLLTTLVGFAVPGTRDVVVDASTAIADRARSVLPDPVPARKVLSEWVEFNNHGSLTLKSSLRNLRSVVTALSTGDGSREEMTRILHERLAEFRETLKVQLLELSRLCIAARVAMPSARVVRGQAKAISKTSMRLDEPAGTIAAKTLERLAQQTKSLYEALEEIEDAVIALYESSLTDAIDRVLNKKLPAHSGEVKFEVKYDSDQMESVNLDENDLVFILENLFDNAIYAMKDSTEKKLKIKAEPSDSYVEVFVSDTGCGIPSELIPGIFEGESTRGGGRGLTRTKEILKRRAGSIKMLETGVGKGTTFVMKLRYSRKKNQVDRRRH
jgi:signal transduction histidine kinase